MQWNKVLVLQAVCCLGQLSFTSCLAFGHFLGQNGPRATSPNWLTASLEHTLGTLVSSFDSWQTWLSGVLSIQQYD